MYYLYILRCSDNSYYTGITNNLQKRFANHKCGKGSRYVFKHLPFKHVYTENFQTKEEAARREKQLKGWCRRKKERKKEF